MFSSLFFEHKVAKGYTFTKMIPEDKSNLVTVKKHADHDCLV